MLVAVHKWPHGRGNGQSTTCPMEKLLAHGKVNSGIMDQVYRLGGLGHSVPWMAAQFPGTRRLDPWVIFKLSNTFMYRLKRLHGPVG